MLDKSTVIEKYLGLLGKQMSIIKNNGGEDSVLAVVTQTWKKNKTQFENKSYEIGRSYNAYYSYIGPASCDITALCEDDYLVCDGVRYYFVRTDKIKIGDRIQFYTGILKKVWESDDNEFEE